jgi:hypothetical protein
MSFDFNVSHIPFRFFCDRLVSNNITNNLIIESSSNNIELNSNNQNFIFNNNAIFNYGINLQGLDVSNIQSITAKSLNVNTLFLKNKGRSLTSIEDYGSIDDGYIRATTIANDISGRSSAYFTYIDVSGGDSSFNNSAYIKNLLTVNGSTTISNDLFVNGTSFVTLYNAINNYIVNNRQQLVTAKVLTNDLSATNISISNELIVHKTSFLNDLSINGELLNNVLKVPGLFTIDPSGHGNNSGTLIVNGDLMVYGNNTIIASSIFEISDVAITVASNLRNKIDLSGNGAGLNISNVASLKYDGSTWNFVGGQLSVENKSVALDGSFIDFRSFSEASLNSLNNYFDLSYGQLKTNNDNSYNAIYSRSQIDNSFMLITQSSFDISLLRSYVDNSFVNKITFDGSFSALKTHLDASYIAKGIYYSRLGQIIPGKVIANYEGRSTSVSINGEGNIVAIGTDYADINGRNTGANVRVYKYNSNSWTLIGDNIDSETTTVYNGNSISLNYSGNIIAIGAIENNTVRAHVRVYRYVNDSSWIKISQTIDCIGYWETYGFSISLNSNGNIVAIGGPMDNGGIRVFQYIMDGSWTQLGIDFEDARRGRYVSLNADGTIVAVGTPGKDNRGEALVYGYNDISWIQISQTITGMINDRTGTSVSLNASGNILAVSSPNSSIYGYNSGIVRVYKYVNDSSWIQLGQDNDIVGDVRTNSLNNLVGDKLGYSISLNSSGNILAVSAFDNGINGGVIMVYKYNDIRWVRLDFYRNILDTYANTYFGTSIALNALGNRVIVSAPIAPYSIGYSIVYDTMFVPIIDSSLNFLNRKLDLSYVSNSVFEGSFNRLKQQIDASFASVSLTSLDSASISVETINTRHYTEKFNNILWNQIGLDISSGPPLTNNNKKVAISNDGKVVAFASSSHSDISKGRIYVYELSYNQAPYRWNLLGLSSEIIVGLSNDDQFGWDLALSSNGRVVAGSSITNDASGINNGQVRVYELSNNTNRWTQKGFNINGLRLGSESGYSISLAGNGNRIAIGAWKDNLNGTNAGAVRVYDFSATINDWRQQGQTLTGVSGSFEGYSTALSLDGQTLASASILEASRNIIGIGGTISTSGGYIIHSFTVVGTTTFTISSSISVEYLIVAGGGSGGVGRGGGGGAGGVKAGTTTLTAGSYTITVGFGGPSMTNNQQGGDGGSSSIGTLIVTTGGGGGGGWNTTSGRNGGSGGGASAGNTLTGGTGISGEGFAGSIRSDGATGGGGGGAGAAASGKDGAIGISSTLTGTIRYYAGGGGAGAFSGTSNIGLALGGTYAVENGTYGGGNGSYVANGTKPEFTDAVANTGGGGGGAEGVGPSGAGGSGIVIIRYLVPDISRGLVKTFTISGSTWTPKGNITGSDISFGRAIKLSGNGNTIVIGAPGYTNSNEYKISPIYEYNSSLMNWQAHRTNALTVFGRDLAVILDASQNEQANTTRNGSSDWAWLGGKRRTVAITTPLSNTGNTAADWEWVTGDVWNYKNFGSNQPDILSETVIHFWTTDGKWNDLTPTGYNIPAVYMYYIIQPLNTGQATGRAYVYGYQGGTTWTQLGQAIQGISGGDEFGSNVAISNDGSIISIGSDNNSSNRGHVRVFAYANNYWNQVSASINGKTSTSRAGIHALSGDGTTLIQSNNTYNSVYGINKTLAVNSPMTTISGNLIVLGNISVNSLDISTNHVYATNGYSYKMFNSDISSAIMKEYFSDVTSSRHLKVQIRGDGAITNRNNSYRALSDSRLKENIVTSGPKLEDLLKVRVVDYTMKGASNTKYIGVLAQELEGHFPNLVTELEPSPKDIEEGRTLKYKAVNYSSFDAILIKSLQEQNAMLKNITRRIETLEEALEEKL